MSSFIEDITLTHYTQHFLGVRIGNDVLKLSAGQAASPTFERDRCYIVCDAHPSLIAFIVRYQPIANSDASDDGVFPIVVSNQKFSFNFLGHGGDMISELNLRPSASADINSPPENNFEHRVWAGCSREEFKTDGRSSRNV